MVAFIQVSEEQLAQAPPEVRAYLTQLRSSVDGTVNAVTTPLASQPPSFTQKTACDSAAETVELDELDDADDAEEVAKPATAPLNAFRATSCDATHVASPEHHLDELNDSLKRIHSLFVNKQPSCPSVAAGNITTGTGTLDAIQDAIQGPSAALSEASISDASSVSAVSESFATTFPVRSRTGLTDDDPFLLAEDAPQPAQDADSTDNTDSTDNDDNNTESIASTNTPPPSPPTIHIQVTLMPPVAPTRVRPVALPDFSGTDAAILEELVQFGCKHWPDKNLGQFRPGEAIGWSLFNELVQHLLCFELYNRNYILGTSPRSVRGHVSNCSAIVWPQYVNNMDTAYAGESSMRHFSIAVVDLQNHSFTSWGMSANMHGEGKADFENSLGFGLMGVKKQLPDYAGNMSAFRCIDAVHDYCLGASSQTADNTHVRLAVLKRFLQRLVDSTRSSMAMPVPVPTGRAAHDISRHQFTVQRRPSVSSRTSLTTGASDTSLSSPHKRHAEEDANLSSTGEPPLKKKDVAPSTELLVQELTNANAVDRMRAHLRNYKTDSSELQWDKQRNWAEQTADILNIANSLDVKQNVTRKVVAMILRTHALRILYKKARIMQEIDENARDPPLPTSIIDQVYPEVRQKKSAAASRRWLTLTRKLEKLGDYLPFIPHGTGTPVTFREYERLSNENLQQLLTHLANDPVGRRIARAGRAFRNHVLYRSNQTYAWENMTSAELRALSNNDLIDLIPKKIRRPAEPNEFDDSDDDDYYEEDDGEGEDDDIEQVVRKSAPGAAGQAMLVNVSLLHPAPSSAAASEDWDVVSSGALSHASRRCSTAQNDVGSGSMALATAGHPYQHQHQRQYSDNYLPTHSPYAGADHDTSGFSMDWVGLPSDDDEFTSDYPDYPSFIEDTTFQEVPAPLPHLSVFVKMPDSHESITFALKGNIDGLAKLFAQGRVSPMHVSDTRGFTLTRWALYGGMSNYKTVQFLLQNGAPVDDESYANAWDFQLRNKCSPDETQALRCITAYKNRDWIDEQAFPTIHKIVFGMSSLHLDEYVRRNPASVHDLDALQRTAMDWAVARKQLNDMRTLIRHGASVETMDAQGRTMLHHAVDSHSLEALRIVLDAGADPNRRVPGRFHRSSALTSASLAHTYAPGMVRLLVRHGAKIDDVNPEGQTALERAALSDNLECARVLVDNGASMDHVSGTGITPIQAAIKHHSYSVLRYFISKKGGYGPDHLIEYVFKYGDKATHDVFFAIQ